MVYEMKYTPKTQCRHNVNFVGTSSSTCCLIESLYQILRKKQGFNFSMYWCGGICIDIMAAPCIHLSFHPFHISGVVERKRWNKTKIGMLDIVWIQPYTIFPGIISVCLIILVQNRFVKVCRIREIRLCIVAPEFNQVDTPLTYRHYSNTAVTCASSTSAVSQSGEQVISLLWVGLCA